MSTAAAALRAAVHAALNADGALVALLGGEKVYDEPPKGAAFPYVTLGEARTLNFSAGDEAGEEHQLTLHGWSRQGGHREAHLVAGALLGAAVVAALVQRDVIAWPPSLRKEAVAPSPLTTALPVPSAAELSVSRAVALHQRGRLHEALAVLDTVPYGDPLRRQADELKVTIQRELLGARGAGAGRDAAGRRP